MQNSKGKIILGVGFVVLVIVGIWFLVSNSKNSQEWLNDRVLIETVEYVCDGNKKITATFYLGSEAPQPQPGEMPVSNNSVDVGLDDDFEASLRQVVSASGARYANEDESLVFWTKGYDAYILKNDEMDAEYQNCTSYDSRNASFTINGEEITLEDGESLKETAPGSSSLIVTKYLGYEVIGDLNGDGLEDRVFLVSQDAGGSGTFYYVVVALRTDTGPSFGYNTTNVFLLGDRVVPQSVVIPVGTSEIQVVYLDREENEPLASAPTKKITLTLKVSPEGVLREAE